MQFMAPSRESADAVRPLERSFEAVTAYEIDAYVGSRLRARRIEVGLSQGALGRQLGLTFSQVQKYEKGTNRIGAGRLYQLAAILNVSTHYFFEALGEPQADRARTDGGVVAEAAKLHAAFLKIADPEARQALLSLASSMAGAT